MKKSICITLFLCLTAIFFSSPQLHALMIGLSIEEITKESEAIVTGKVVKTKSYWSEDGNIILTKAFIKVQNVIKGNVARKKIVVEYEGGEVQDVGLEVSDMPKLEKGEKVILFLESQKAKNGKANENIYEIVGNAQGKYVVGKDGIARRDGFCVVNEKEIIGEDSMSTDRLINKIKGVKDEF